MASWNLAASRDIRSLRATMSLSTPTSREGSTEDRRVEERAASSRERRPFAVRVADGDIVRTPSERDAGRWDRGRPAAVNIETVRDSRRDGATVW